MKRFRQLKAFEVELVISMKNYGVGREIDSREKGRKERKKKLCRK